MTEFQRLFLVQARSDFKIFKLLREKCESQELPPCHALHYLQMATEKLAKARAWKDGPIGESHLAFDGFLKGLKSNRQVQKQLGYEGKNESWRQLIRKSGPLAKAVEDLAPSIAKDGPNPEYPWPRAAPRYAPAEYEFTVWANLQKPSDGPMFLNLVGSLFAVAETFLD
jgi:hypothetical protein